MIASVLLAACLAPAFAPAFATEVRPAAAPIVIAHRGASGLLPEHTTQAVAVAHALGADYIEQDVVLTRDGVPIVLHDLHLDATTNVAEVFPDRAAPNAPPGRRYSALDFTLAEIKTLRVSERFDPKTGRAVFPSRFPPHTGEFAVPTLAEELDLIAGLNAASGRTVGIYPELKRPAEHAAAGLDLAAAVLRTLAERGYTTRDDRCFLQCFDLKELKRVRHELGCELNLVYLTSSAPKSDAEWAEIVAVCDGFGPAWPAVVRFEEGALRSTGLAERARAAGLAVHPWTARFDAMPAGQEGEAGFAALHEALIAAGATGLFSDFPGRSARLLRRR
ncbi:glycerophosphodiester phosphodiesterase family protein [Alienimonas californiensis]|uniref:glycerophosphodiester phosphodiesterase n=1 Tax=Alienimonas californiensis TaxID=2527989 RepID=A0A517P4Y6_9PLAN|nr:glycerophosphodiester phosphodiesterase family protein [Alienimonas californiensis]QDT14448.1 Glycerophosphoryl diester phosphodiesterase precursor [Alienimonas californiensis]